MQTLYMDVQMTISYYENQDQYNQIIKKNYIYFL